MVCNLSTGVYNRGYGSGFDKGYGSGFDKGYGSGFDSGISTGEMKKAKETAYRLQRKGMSVNEIADLIDVSVDKIREWLAEPQAT